MARSVQYRFHATSTEPEELQWKPSPTTPPGAFTSEAAMFLFEQFLLWWEVLLWEGIRTWREYLGINRRTDDGAA
jgi:hypothetical protein